jgi:hypothetical protein
MRRALGIRDLLLSAVETPVRFLQFLLDLLRHWSTFWTVFVLIWMFGELKVPVSHWITGLLWGAAVVLVAFGAWREQFNRAEKAERALQDFRKQKPGRVFIEEPLERLLELRKEPSGLRLLNRLAPYIGKWVRLSGRAVAVAESLSADSFHLTVLLDNGDSVNLQFSNDAREQLRSLREGQRVTALCEIATYDLGRFEFRNCELTGLQAVTVSPRPPIVFIPRHTRKTG